MFNKIKIKILASNNLHPNCIMGTHCINFDNESFDFKTDYTLKSSCPAFRFVINQSF